MKPLPKPTSLLRASAHRVLRDRVFIRSVGPARGLRMRAGPSGAMLLDCLRLGMLLSPTREQEFLASLSGLEGRTVYDVGGFIGELTLGFANKVGPSGRVITFEPNPLNVRAIRANVALNRLCPVEVIPVGVGRGPATLELVYDPTGTATGTLDAAIQNSMAAIPVERCQVEVDSLDSLVRQHQLPPPHLVKIDVEGLELDVLEGMSGLVSQYTPSLYIELHGVGIEGKRANARAVISWLSTRGYSLYHVESGRNLSLSGEEEITSGHLMASHP